MSSHGNNFFFNSNTRTSPKQLLDGFDIKLNYCSQKNSFVANFECMGTELNEAVLETLKIQFNGSHDTLWMPNSLLSYFIQQFIATSHLRLEISLLKPTNTFARRGFTNSGFVFRIAPGSFKKSTFCDLESVELTWHLQNRFFWGGSLFVDSGFWKFLIWFGFNKTLLPAGLVIKIHWTSVEKLSFGYFRRSSLLARDVTIYLQSAVGVVFSDWPPQPTRW